MKVTQFILINIRNNAQFGYLLFAKKRQSHLVHSFACSIVIAMAVPSAAGGACVPTGSAY